MAVNVLRRRVCEMCRLEITHNKQRFTTRFYGTSRLTNGEIRRKRNALFEEEKQRQRSFIKRIEKVNVYYKGQPEDTELVMNRDISTPYNCAMHLGELFAKRAVVAKVNDRLWDMHTPLTEDCELELLHMKDEDATLPNQVFWRSCSFILGYVLENAFKDNVYVELCSFPKPRVESGSFVYDVELNLPDWKPSFMELNSLSLEAMALIDKKIEFERLEVDAALAQRMFEDNRFKIGQIPSIAEKSSQGRVTLYRMGEHVDITTGPLIADTSQIGRFSVTAIHSLYTEIYGRLQRVQGVALPRDVNVHRAIYEHLQKAARRKNLDGIRHFRKDFMTGENIKTKDVESLAY